MVPSFFDLKSRFEDSDIGSVNKDPNEQIIVIESSKFKQML